MGRIVVYYTRTGNTEKMAKAVAEGASRVEGMKSKNKLVEFLKE